jgi:outer membrane protein assembly factor BamB
MPTAANGLVYVNGDDGCLYFLRADTGSFGNPTCLIGGRAVGGPAADASHVYTAALDGTLAAYGHHSGTLEWRTDLKSRIAASPFVDGRLLFVPLATGEIVVYVAATLDLGQAARLAAPPADGASSTQMSGSAVVAGAGDTLHIVTVTNTGQTWALSAYAKAHLSISPLTTVPGRPLPPSGAGGLPAPR